MRTVQKLFSAGLLSVSQTQSLGVMMESEVERGTQVFSREFKLEAVKLVWE